MIVAVEEDIDMTGVRNVSAWCRVDLHHLLLM